MDYVLCALFTVSKEQENTHMLMPCAAVHAGPGAGSICIATSMFSAAKAAEKKESFGGKCHTAPLME